MGILNFLAIISQYFSLKSSTTWNLWFPFTVNLWFAFTRSRKTSLHWKTQSFLHCRVTNCASFRLLSFAKSLTIRLFVSPRDQTKSHSLRSLAICRDLKWFWLERKYTFTKIIYFSSAPRLQTLNQFSILFGEGLCPANRNWKSKWGTPKMLVIFGEKEQTNEW